MEHVRDVDLAFQGIASILKPGGLALIFVPSRNALYARINMIIPSKLKTKLLDYLYPEDIDHHGFPSYYDRCTPRDFRLLAEQHGFMIEEEHFYFVSSYFESFFLLYVLWRIWLLWFYLLTREQAAETFSIALKRFNY